MLNKIAILSVKTPYEVIGVSLVNTPAWGERAVNEHNRRGGNCEGGNKVQG